MKNKVLLIEDNPGDVRLLRAMLAEVKKAPFDLKCADRLSTGLERLAVGDIDIVLLDLLLPDSQGFDTFTQVQAQAPQMPIIVLSGLDDEAQAVKAVREGAQDYLVKGEVDGNLLVRAIRYAIERKQAEESLKELNTTLEERVRQRTLELQMLYELTQQIGYTINYDDLFHLILEHLHRVMEYDIAGSLLVSDGVCNIFLRTVRPTGEEVIEQVKKRLLTAYGRMSGVGFPRERVVVSNSRAADHDDSLPFLHYLGSYFQVPLFVGKAFQGLVFVGAEQGQEFKEDHLRIFYTLAQQAGDSVQRLRVLLAAERERMERVVQNLPAGVILLDDENRILLANPAASEILYLLGERVMGEILTHLGPHSLEEVLQQGEGVVPLTMTVKDPEQRVFEVTAQPIPSEQPERGSTIVVLRDVTELRKIEGQARQQDRLAAVGQLAAGIAHDFNNMLTTILVYAQMLLVRPHLPSDLATGLETIRDETRRAANLVGQVLDFSRSSPVETYPVDLRSFVKETGRILQRTLPESIRLTVEIGAKECIVNADPIRIQQVLMNLVLNARDAMLGSGELQIALSRVEVKPDEEPPVAEMSSGVYVCLAVSDTGTGIPSGILPHIFDPFFTTKSRDKGTGLGLSQVYGIVKQHEGEIGVETEMGEGTTFRVYLPAHVAEEEVEETPKESVVFLQGEGETILLVEDNQRLRDLGQNLLESLGYHVLAAADGHEALEVHQAVEGVDLVITDMVMPEMGGRELIQELRKVDPALRALVITGYTPEEALQGFEKEGIPSVVQKPFDIGTLTQAVYHVLGKE